MEILASEVASILKNNKVSKLYHANTVRTSCTFLTQGELLARGAVEQRGLAQSPQYTDAVDKELGIWDDIFFDTCDIHDHRDMRNYYGPVLFSYDLSLLSSKLIQFVRVTKFNPSGWKPHHTQKDLFFSCSAEMKNGFRFGQFGQHILVRCRRGTLPFSQHQPTVTLDDPQLNFANNVSVHSSSISTLSAHNSLSLGIAKRVCSACCTCITHSKKGYHNIDTGELDRLFLP